MFLFPLKTINPAIPDSKILTSYIQQVPYIDAKVASTHVLPALITLGSDQNLNVKYASIDAFGAVAQHFKNDMVQGFYSDSYCCSSYTLFLLTQHVADC